MKLFYYQRSDQQPNFGDELNRWLWPKLSPTLFNETSGPGARQAAEPEGSTVFVGTGTLLNHKLPRRIAPAKKLIVFSTGAGYEQPLKRIPETWEIFCVRGPLSAQQLGLPSEKAIADGGILVAKVFTPEKIFSSPQPICSFMPHIHSAIAAEESWQRICAAANIRYIDPRWPVETVLQAIGSSERLLAEAMHGAIVADALRVPWLPVITTPRVYAFKWQDWCASMALPYRPRRLPPLADYPRWGKGLRSGAVAARHWCGAARGVKGAIATTRYALFADESAIVRALQNMAQQPFFLSADSILEQRLARLQDCFNLL